MEYRVVEWMATRLCEVENEPDWCMWPSSKNGSFSMSFSYKLLCDFEQLRGNGDWKMSVPERIGCFIRMVKTWKTIDEL